MKRLWQISNILSLIFALVMNILVGAQLLNLPSIVEISDTFATYLTPAGYAFSIWSVIYLLLIGFVIYQARDFIVPNKNNQLPQKIGPYFIIASICNGLWTYVFVSGYISLSVVILLILTTSLYVILWRLKIALTNPPLRTLAFVWWPLLLYTGWVTAASVVNIASWLASLGVIISPYAALLVIVVLGAALLGLLIMRNVRELVLASTWAIIAIGVEQTSDNQLVMTAAFMVSALLLMSIAVHVYANRRALPSVS